MKTAKIAGDEVMKAADEAANALKARVAASKAADALQIAAIGVHARAEEAANNAAKAAVMKAGDAVIRAAAEKAKALRARAEVIKAAGEVARAEKLAHEKADEEANQAPAGVASFDFNKTMDAEPTRETNVREISEAKSPSLWSTGPLPGFDTAIFGGLVNNVEAKRLKAPQAKVARNSAAPADVGPANQTTAAGEGPPAPWPDGAKRDLINAEDAGAAEGARAAERAAKAAESKAAAVKAAEEAGEETDGLPQGVKKKMASLNAAEHKTKPMTHAAESRLAPSVVRMMTEMVVETHNNTLAFAIVGSFITFVLVGTLLIYLEQRARALRESKKVAQ